MVRVPQGGQKDNLRIQIIADGVIYSLNGHCIGPNGLDEKINCSWVAEQKGDVLLVGGVLIDAKAIHEGG